MALEWGEMSTNGSDKSKDKGASITTLLGWGITRYILTSEEYRCDPPTRPGLGRSSCGL